MCRTALFLFVLLAGMVTAAGGAYLDGMVMRMSDRQVVGFPQMIDDAAGADVVFVSETHDNYRHHATELEIIRALQARKVALAIGLEMFQSDGQQALDDWTAGRLTEKQFIPLYYRNWNFDWSLYREIFLYAREHRIPMLALNIPKRIVFKVAGSGFASLTAAERKGLPARVTCDLSNPQTAFLRHTFKEVYRHEAGGRLFDYFCEAQAVRNSGMAMNIARYLKREPGRTMVVLTGDWHAVKYGIPGELGRFGSFRSRVLFSIVPGLDARNATSDMVDYLIGWR